jgi:hypothetical protein
VVLKGVSTQSDRTLHKPGKRGDGKADTKGSKPDYETLLAQLSSQIDESRVHLSEIRLRERRWSLLINLYGIALWAVLVGLWWTRTLPLGLLGWRSDGTEAKIIGAAIVGAAPVLSVHEESVAFQSADTQAVRVE